MSVDLQPYAGALEAIDRILNREPEADEVLRQTVAVLHDRIDHYSYAAIAFVEDGALVVGPTAGEERPGARRLDLPIVYRGDRVGMLQVDTISPSPPGAEEERFLGRVATLVSAHCLVGWDTGGEPWPEPSP